MIFHLIRHGRTEANEKRLYCGSSDVPLSKAGIKELIELKTQIGYPPAQVCIVSGLVRAVQTAEILFGSHSFTVIKNLCEINFGDFEMHSHEELKVLPPYQHWISNIETAEPPGGESAPVFAERVMRGFQEAQNICQSKAASSAVIVAHGGVIAAVMESFFPKQRNFYEWQPAHGRGYTFRLQNRVCENLGEI